MWQPAIARPSHSFSGIGNGLGLPASLFHSYAYSLAVGVDLQHAMKVSRTHLEPRKKPSKDGDMNRHFAGSALHRLLLTILCVLLSAPVRSASAQAHVTGPKEVDTSTVVQGDTTDENVVSIVGKVTSVQMSTTGMTFLNIGRSWAFAAIVLTADSSSFPNPKRWEGKAGARDRQSATLRSEGGHGPSTALATGARFAGSQSQVMGDGKIEECLG